MNRGKLRIMYEFQRKHTFGCLFIGRECEREVIREGAGNTLKKLELITIRTIQKRNNSNVVGCEKVFNLKTERENGEKNNNPSTSS